MPTDYLPPAKACVRVLNSIRNLAPIEAAARHARGDDGTARERRQEDTPYRAFGMAWQDGGFRGGIIQHGRKNAYTDYAGAYKRWKADTGVSDPRTGCQIAQHVLCIVSPSAIEGDPWNPRNPSVRKLVRDAVQWANSEFGDKATWAARYDVDEAGAGVVDLLVSPHHEFRIGRGKPKDRIAVAAAHDRIRRKWGARYSYSALQDSWAQWAQERGWNVERGIPKGASRREHLSPEAYKRLDDVARQAFDAQADRIAALEAELQVRPTRARRD